MGHGHGHGTAETEIDWAAMADTLELEGQVYEPYVRGALEELSDLAPKRILDIGSGPGAAACQIAEQFGDAEVIAVDGSPELLERAEKLAARKGVHLNTKVADFPEHLSELGLADLVWSSHVIHHVGDQQDALNKLAELLNSAGMLAITEGGLPTRWLPRDCGLGRPGLEERLDVARSEWFNQMRDETADSVAVIEDWSSMLRSAGLTDVYSKTFLIDHPAPLAERLRGFVRDSLDRARQFEDLLDAEDVQTVQRLLDPDDPLGVDRRADLFLKSARTVHFGRKP